MISKNKDEAASDQLKKHISCMKMRWYTNTGVTWFAPNSWKRKLVLSGRHKRLSNVKVLWTDPCFLLMLSAHTEEQSAALHLTYACGCKDYLEQMLNIKNVQWIVASFSLAKVKHILSLLSQRSASQVLLMHRLEHSSRSWRIRSLCSKLGTCLLNGLWALFVCCSILAMLWSSNS